MTFSLSRPNWKHVEIYSAMSADLVCQALMLMTGMNLQNTISGHDHIKTLTFLIWNLLAVFVSGDIRVLKGVANLMHQFMVLLELESMEGVLGDLIELFVQRHSLLKDIALHHQRQQILHGDLGIELPPKVRGTGLGDCSVVSIRVEVLCWLDVGSGDVSLSVVNPVLLPLTRNKPRKL